MAITAAQVKELREMTGAGMMDCKKALTATEGDMDKAVEFLREKGLATAQKKASRVAAFLAFPCPSVLARSALVPTPVPIPTATISICTGNTSVSALSAASLPTFMFPTKALSTML